MLDLCNPGALEVEDKPRYCHWGALWDPATCQMPGTLCGWSGPRATGASAAPTVHAPQLPPRGPHCDPLRNPRGPRHPLRRLPRGLQLHPLRAREANCLRGMRVAHTLSASGQRPPAPPPAGLGRSTLVPSECTLGTGPGAGLAGALSSAYGHQQSGWMLSTHPIPCLLGHSCASP